MTTEATTTRPTAQRPKARPKKSPTASKPRLTLACEARSFATALSVFAPVIHARNELSAFVMIEARDAGVTLRGTDLETWLATALEPVEVTHPGAIAVPLALLREAVRKSTTPAIILKAESDDVLLVKTDDGYVRINGRHPRELPAPPRLKADATVTFPSSALGAAIREVEYAAAGEHSRYALNGVLFQAKGKRIRLAATDGRRLAVTTLDANGTIPGRGVIAPNGCVSALARLCSAKAETDVQLQIATARETGTILTFVAEKWSLATRAVEGEYPLVDEVIPRNAAIIARMSAAPLAAAVKQAAIVCDRESAVRLAFSGKEVQVGAAGLPGDAALRCPVQQYRGDPVTIGVNPRFIGDVLSLIGEEITIGINDPVKPVLFEKPDAVHVLMPMNVDQVINNGN